MKIHEKICLDKDENGAYRYDMDYYKGCLYDFYPYFKQFVNIYENAELDRTSYMALCYKFAQMLEQDDRIGNINNMILWGDTPIEKLYFECFNYVCWSEKIKLYLIPQYNIEANDKEYRVDFMVCCEYFDESKAKKYVVECDGFNYHSSTKQQARDNQRQRDLENAGYIVIRFSGSEIYNDPVKCVYETLKRLDIEIGDENNE